MKETPIYTIPAGYSFVDVFAKGVLELANGDSAALSRMQILLPTRRACRSLRDAFLKLSNGRPTLLPRMHPLGDVDEDELSMFMAQEIAGEELSLPPAISATRRQFLLTKLIGQRGYGRGIVQDMELARALAQLMDQTYTEDLDLKDLPKLVESEAFASHWQVSIEFLSIISGHWPNILKELGVIDSADRRNRLLKNLSEHWQKNAPAHFVIAAGTTGSIPATARLLKTITDLPKGMIVLPGLDQSLDEDSWGVMDDTHPQATLKNLLKTLEVNRNSVQTWPACTTSKDTKASIRAFVGEVMRPSDTTQVWQSLKDKKIITPQDMAIERYDCENPQEEALVIALALRRALEDKNTLAALVTPDRNLARRVTMACRRWGIEIDDSAGQPLSQTSVGLYLRLCMECVIGEMMPVALLSFCKHGKCRPAYKNWRSEIRAFDKHAARGPMFQGGLDGYNKNIGELKDDSSKEKFQNLLSFIQTGFSDLLVFEKTDKRPFADWVYAHLKAAEYFCPAEILWAGQEGEEASVFFSALLQEKDAPDDLSAQDYMAVLTGLMKAVSVRPRYGLHPRVMILGQLEARLLEADTMILSGLNEGTWPQKISADPWMSRPMRKEFGLPSHERSIGLSAHDFAQSLCADKVIITRSTRVDGTPTVPSRWLQRMDTVIRACNLPDDILTHNKPLLSLARGMDIAAIKTPPLRRPEPRPPVSSRPRELPVTKIDMWMNDPYSIYAQYILKLKPLKDLEQDMDAALRGTLIHDVLKDFFGLYKDKLPPDIVKAFVELAIAGMDKVGLEKHRRTMWLPRLQKIGTWLAVKEQEMREAFIPTISEEKGRMTLDGKAGAFTLTCRADRIDVSKDGQSAAIIDYKSGGQFSTKGMVSGLLPQLPLEALIVEQGGFEKCKKIPSSLLAYWIINGSKDGGKIIKLESEEKIRAAMEQAKDGLNALIDAFDEESTPYMSLPKPHKAPKYNDYEHLARVKEWIALDDAGNDFEDGEAA